MSDYLRIGILSSPHGVRGEISVFPTSDDYDRYKDLDEVFFDIKGNMEPHKVTGCKYKKNMPVLKFEGIDDRDSVETLRGIELYVDKEHAIPLEEGEYYVADILGFDVISDTDNSKIGVLEDYMENAADQLIYLVKCNDGSIKYVPDIEEFVLDVDMDGRTVLVHLIPGM